ncbi:MAG: mannosyl-3-phosphoglycerate phosphatase [Chloroflexota bacterium]
MARWVVFTDLDGSLLELDTYSYQLAQPAVELLRARQIPLVFCSSKTRAEQEFYRRKLGVDAPFVVENGSAIFIPQGYFDFTFPRQRSVPGYDVIELGAPAAAIRQAIAEIRTGLGLACYGYADLPLADISRLTGLDVDAAQRAGRREYSETLLKSDITPAAWRQFQTALAHTGLAGVAGSRFYTITGAGSDKGQATVLLAGLFRRKFGVIATVGLGDSPNDEPLLAAVDHPFLVQQPGGRWAGLNLPRLEKVAGVGPAGWQSVIFKLFPDG